MQAFPSCVVQHGAGTVIITVYEYASVACVLVLFQVSRPLGLLFLHAEAINKLVEQDQARMRHLPSLEELGAKDVSLDQLLNSLSSSVVRKDLGTEAQVGDQVYACMQQRFKPTCSMHKVHIEHAHWNGSPFTSCQVKRFACLPVRVAACCFTHDRVRHT